MLKEMLPTEIEQKLDAESLTRTDPGWKVSPDKTFQNGSPALAHATIIRTGCITCCSTHKHKAAQKVPSTAGLICV